MALAGACRGLSKGLEVVKVGLTSQHKGSIVPQNVSLWSDSLSRRRRLNNGKCRILEQITSGHFNLPAQNFTVHRNQTSIKREVRFSRPQSLPVSPGHGYDDGVSRSNGAWWALFREQQRKIQGSAARCLASSATESDVAFDVEVSWEETFQSTTETEAVLKQFKADAALAVMIATDGLEELDDAETVELSVMLCGDNYIHELNKEWLNEDRPTDVLSFPQDQPPGLNPTLLLGDVIISVDTAARQAEERGHTLLDELRILLIHGLLHVLGFDHEEGPQAEKEMAKEERRILAALGWKGEGLITGSQEGTDGKQGGPGGSSSAGGSAPAAGVLSANGIPEDPSSSTKPSAKRTKRSPFRYLFCDMDGTLLNSESKISQPTADALRAAKDRGVTIVIATGKARPAAMAALDSVGLAGETGVVSLASPGVFLQGLRVYGREGAVVHSALLPEDVCQEAFAFADQRGTALIGFSGDRCVTLFDHPLVEKLHSTFYEPRARVMDSIEHLMAETPIQKLLFYDTVEGVKEIIRPHWSLALQGRASVTQAVADMLEILPHGASKGSGVQILLDHLKVPAEQVMALGDGENDMEMINMVGWGVAMANGSPKTLAVANATVRSNDDDGVVEAIERFILS